VDATADPVHREWLKMRKVGIETKIDASVQHRGSKRGQEVLENNSSLGQG